MCQFYEVDYKHILLQPYPEASIWSIYIWEFLSNMIYHGKNLGIFDVSGGIILMNFSTLGQYLCPPI